MLLTASSDVRERLESARTIAVLGAHHERHRAACYVPEYLHAVGYRVWSVNPVLAGEVLFGERVVATLAELPEPVDMIDVFRRPSALPAHLDEILALPWRPRTIWLQLGVVHATFTRGLLAAGYDVVEDRCTLADHRTFGLASRHAR